jgi:hypothetical protein
VAEALRESSAYYLLAWRPDTENQKAGKSRIDVVIKDRPDLRVRMRRHFFELKSSQVGSSARLESAAAAKAAPEDELRAALGSLYPHRGLPVALSAGYLNTLDQAPLLSLAMQIDAETLGFAGPEGKQEAVVDVLGVALDDRGSFSSFKQKLKIPRETVNAKAQRFVTWSQTLQLQPGLYQVRVAVRDSQSGRTGGAIEWIEVPRIEPGRFSMSSLFLTERPATSGTAANKQERTNVDHRFARTSALRLQTYVYNAARNPGAPDNLPEVWPDVWIGAQIFRGEQQIMTVAPRRIPQDAAKDSWRLSYSAEIALGQLPAGSYSLQVTATHKPSGATSIQRINFSVE